MSENEEFVSEVAQDILKDRIKAREEDRLDAVGIISDTEKGGGGALHKLITVSDNLLQRLYMANLMSPEEGDDVSAAIEESLRYGCEVESIERWIVAQCGVAQQHKSVREWGVQSLTHLDINNPGDPAKRGGWMRRGGSDKGGEEKPLS